MSSTQVCFRSYLDACANDCSTLLPACPNVFTGTINSFMLFSSGTFYFKSGKKKSENKRSSDIKITLFFLFATAEAASGHCCHLPSSEPPNRHLPQRCPTTARVHQSPALLFHTRIMDLTVPHNLPYLILQHPIFSLFSAAPRFSFSYPISYSLDAVQTSADLKCPCNVLLILWLNNKKSTE